MNEVDPNLKKLGNAELEKTHFMYQNICSAFDRQNATMLERSEALVLRALINAPEYADRFGREFLETLKVHAMTKNMLYMALGKEALHLDRAINELAGFCVVNHIWHKQRSIYVLAESAYKLKSAMFSVRDVRVTKAFLRHIEKREQMYPADWVAPTLCRSLQN